MLQVAFRTDASIQIGTGHFMRCLALAEGLKQRGAHIRFISRALPTYLCDVLATKAIEFVALSNETSPVSVDDLVHAPWLVTSQQLDAEDTSKVLSGRLWDWLIVDHYALDRRWESELRIATKQIMVIDDIADRQHDCDVLLDQNFYRDMKTRYVDKVPSHCQLLLGPRYALLREVFAQLRKQAKPREGPIKRILVFFGGIDADNCTGLAIQALSEMGVPDIHVDVVIGTQHPCRDETREACLRYGFACHVQTERMAELMAAADLAIGAGGSACWERCCLGLPAILVALADNQIKIAEDLDSYGACIYIGTLETASVSVIRNAIVGLLSKQDQIRMIAKKASSLVDGFGIDSVCQKIGC